MSQSRSFSLIVFLPFVTGIMIGCTSIGHSMKRELKEVPPQVLQIAAFQLRDCLISNPSGKALAYNDSLNLKMELRYTQSRFGGLLKTTSKSNLTKEQSVIIKECDGLVSDDKNDKIDSTLRKTNYVSFGLEKGKNIVVTGIAFPLREIRIESLDIE